ELANGGDDSFARRHIRYYERVGLARTVKRMTRMCAAAGLAVHGPYLSKRLSECVFSFPYHVLNRGGVKKSPVVAIASRMFGEAFARREKIGFSVPNRRWFRSGTGLGRYRTVLLDDRTIGREFYDGDSLRKAFLVRLESGDAPLDYVLWSVLNLEIWMRIFIEGDSPESYGGLES
ncbi:MAG: asparagine synthase-related protein, partial [Planctomycetota bacterium]